MSLPAPTDHRPWQVPNRPWVMWQTWRNLLFAHWAVSPDVIRPMLPSGITLDTFDGAAWLGVVPFQMANVHPRFMPAVPWLSFFPELNVRTYVKYQDQRPGVWFFSLEAANPLAVMIARRWFHLNYMHARMTCEAQGKMIVYNSQRTHDHAPEATFIATYRPVSAVFESKAGTLDAWLTERYSLYTQNRQGQLYIGEIHHARWQLQHAQADITQNSMGLAHGIKLPAAEPLLHFAREIDVVVWGLEKLT